MARTSMASIKRTVRATFGQIRSDEAVIVNLLCGLGTYIQHRHSDKPNNARYAKDCYCKAMNCAREWGASINETDSGFELRSGSTVLAIPSEWINLF